jgi:hypothetical protein
MEKERERERLLLTGSCWSASEGENWRTIATTPGANTRGQSSLDPREHKNLGNPYLNKDVYLA